MTHRIIEMLRRRCCCMNDVPAFPTIFYRGEFLSIFVTVLMRRCLCVYTSVGSLFLSAGAVSVVLSYDRCHNV